LFSRLSSFDTPVVLEPVEPVEDGLVRDVDGDVLGDLTRRVHLACVHYVEDVFGAGCADDVSFVWVSFDGHDLIMSCLCVCLLPTSLFCSPKKQL